MEKKYKLSDISTTLNNGKKIYRIQALRDFGNVSEGELGGFVESEDNLSHEGTCWLYNNSAAIGNAVVKDNATLHDMVVISGNAEVYENATIKDRCSVFCDAKVHGEVKLLGSVDVYDNADIHGNIRIEGALMFNGNADISSSRHFMSVYPVKIDIKNDVGVDGNDDSHIIIMHFYKSSDGKILVATNLSDDPEKLYMPIDELPEKITGGSMEEVSEGSMTLICSLCEFAKTYIQI